MSKIMTILEERVAPAVNKIGGQRHLRAVRNGIISMLPLTIVGSFFVIFLNVPIPGYDELIAPIKASLDIPFRYTVGIMSIYVSFGIAHQLAKSYNLDELTSGFLAVAGFLISSVVPTQVSKGVDGVIAAGRWMPIAKLSASSLFGAILASIISVEIYRFFRDKNIVIKMPDGVPPAVAKSFAALIPGMIILTVVWLIRLGLMYTPFEDMHNIVRVLLVGPLTKIGGTYWGALVVTLLIHLLWMTGIHGAALIMGIISPVTYKLMAENNAAYMAGARGTELPHVVTTQFFDIFQSMGGSGSTFSLAIILFLFSKSKQLKEIGKLAVGPAFFNINEPILFGLPIVMNPLMLIPFVLSPVVVITITYWSMKLGLVSRLAGIAIPWTTPPVLGGALATASISGGVIQVISMVLTFFIYYPFFKIMDAQKLKEEQAAVSA